jgi:hypothetical protein
MEATFRQIAVVVAVLVTSGSATAAHSAHHTPVTQLAPSCLRDHSRTAAFQLVVDFFGAVNGRRYGAACSRLAARLTFSVAL